MAQATHQDVHSQTTETGSADAAGRQTTFVQNLLTKLRDAIWSRRPVLGDIQSKHGDDTLYDYSQDFLDANPSPLLDARKPTLISVVEELLTSRLGASVAGEVAQQLTKLPLVSTTDHHATIDHPFFVNANIVSAIPFFELNVPDLSHLVVFSFAGISVNNDSGYPRGIEFHGGMNGSGNEVRLPILPDKLKMGVVYGTRGFTREDLDRAEASARTKERNGEIAPGRSEKIVSLLETYFATDDVLSSPDLNTQITKINYKLWPQLFHKAPQQNTESAPDKKVPNLVYLEIETLVKELLLRHHLTESSSLIHSILFKKDWQALAFEHFNNLPGAFSREKGWGTHYFWGVDSKQHRVRLKIEGETLRSEDGSIVIDYTPEGVAQALRNGTIFPSMLTCYLLVSLYYGMKCLGGFCQVHDLTMIKKAWKKILETQGCTEEAEALTPVQTKELGGDGMVLAYFESIQGGLVPATGIDMILETADTSYDGYVELAKKMTLIEAMNPLLPEIYNVLYIAEERESVLSKLKPEAILEATGLHDRVHEYLKSHQREPSIQDLPLALRS